MTAALYHPEHGYYRKRRDPFGKHGDFYTAEQVQPVFGILIAQCVRELAAAMGNPPDFTVVELGAGRGEMAEAFAEFHYIPVDLNRGELPRSFCGVVFSNEFFDALPVDSIIYKDGEFREWLVTHGDSVFQWIVGEPVSRRTQDRLRDYY